MTYLACLFFNIYFFKHFNGLLSKDNEKLEFI